MSIGVEACTLCSVLPCLVERTGNHVMYQAHHSLECPNREDHVTWVDVDRPDWDEIFMVFARSLARRSTCRRLAVGCVVVSEDNTRILAMGYNGNYPGGPNDCESDEPGKCGCFHSEMSALIKLGRADMSRKVMYVTHSPCKTCAKAILLAGIDEVVYGLDYRSADGTDLLRSRGIPVRRFVG